MTNGLVFAADDLSGASELAAEIATSMGDDYRRGSVTVVLDRGIEMLGKFAKNPILVIDLNTRNASEVAISKSIDRFLSLSRQRSQKAFLKVDSLLRGRIAEHLQLLTGHGRVIFCPALPSLDRFVEDGAVVVGSVPLAKTNLWQDEAMPAPSKISDLFGSWPTARLTRKHYATATSLSEWITSQDSSAVLIADCTSAQELKELSSSAAKIGEIILAGSGELGNLFANELLNGALVKAAGPVSIRKITGSALIVVGSISEVSEGQLRFLESRGSRSFNLESLIADSSVLLGQANQWLQDRASITVSKKSLKKTLLSSETRAWFANLLADRPLVLTGGATARAILDFLGVEYLQPLRAIGHGLTIANTDLGILVAIKPGSFGELDTLHKLANQIEI